MEAGSSDGPYASRSVLHHSLSYSPETPLGSYASLLDSSSLSGLPSAGGHQADSPQSNYTTAPYRLMPPSQPSPFSDITMPPSHLFHPVDPYHGLDDRMRSPVPYF